MKINNQEVDMKKVLKTHLLENKLKEVPKKELKGENIKLKQWYHETIAGEAKRERLKERCKSGVVYNKKTMYKLTNLETKEEIIIEGAEAVAKFLGYARINSYRADKDGICHHKGNKKLQFKKEII